MRWTVASGEHYERNLTETLRRLVTLMSGPVIYDVGASYGFYTLSFAGQARWVYAFEPVSGTFEVLVRNVERNRLVNATAFKRALSDEETEAQINLYSSSGTNSLVWALPANHPAKLVGHEVVRVTTLDKIVAEERLLAPAIIKLDIEGAELQALRGGRQVISKTRPVLVLESRDEPWFDSGYSRAALLQEVSDHDYVLAGLSKDYDDLELHPVEDFDRVPIANIIGVPSERTELLEGIGPSAARVLQRL